LTSLNSTFFTDAPIAQHNDYDRSQQKHSTLASIPAKKEEG
jgi:hypothetical protein